MPIGWFFCPYKRRQPRSRPTRYCAMDDFAAQITADGGAWTEAECLGNHAVVKVRASAASLQTIAGTAGYQYVNAARLDDPLSTLTPGERTALRNFVTNTLGYPLAELQARFPSGDLGDYTLGDVLRFVLRRRLRPRYDKGADVIVVDGPVQPTRPVASVDGAVT
jgi:hypothetical protein